MPLSVYHLLFEFILSVLFHVCVVRLPVAKMSDMQMVFNAHRLTEGDKVRGVKFQQRPEVKRFLVMDFRIKN